MYRINLEKLPKRKLVELIAMYSRNWQSLDGLWFANVEKRFGLEAAVSVDLENWEKQSTLEAKRIVKALDLKGGLESVLKALSLMSWQIASPLFEIEEESSERIVFYYDRCAVQESRLKNGKPQFPCKTMKTLLLTSIAKIAEPRAAVKCLCCPPDARADAYWCRWELSLPES